MQLLKLSLIAFLPKAPKTGERLKPPVLQRLSMMVCTTRQNIYSTYLPFSTARSRLRVEAGPPIARVTDELGGYALDALKNHYNRERECVHHILDRNPPLGSQRLRRTATFYEYILLDGRRITPTQRTLRKNAGSSLIKTVIHGQRFCGAVASFFRHEQPNITDDTLWAEVTWMEDQFLSPVDGDPWSD
jgi:hypothetical protein